MMLSFDDCDLCSFLLKINFKLLLNFILRLYCVSYIILDDNKFLRIEFKRMIFACKEILRTKDLIERWQMI